MNNLKEYTEKLVNISEEEWHEILKIFTLKRFKKGENIYDIGDTTNSFYYLSSGIARTYYINENYKEITWSVHRNSNENLEDAFLNDYISYLKCETSKLCCESLVDCEVYSASYEKLEKLYETNIKYMKFAKLNVEQAMIKMANLSIYYNMSASDKYKYIKQHKAFYEDILPDYQLATVLGITPQSLSRLKMRIGDKI